MPVVAWLWPSILAALLAGTQWWRRRNWPLNFADEAYLWHGTRLVCQGAVPLRDFRSYEPGRYWWCAATLRLLGDRLVQLRLAGHVAWGLGLAVLGTALVGFDSAPVIIVATLTAGALWAEPQHKLFEPAIMATGVAVGAAMLADGSLAAAVAAGVVVGLISLVGVNVAGYLAVAIAVLALIGPAGVQGALAAGLGLAVGLFPLLVWAAATGAWRALWHRRVVAILQRGTTNLPLPVSWPWREPLRAMANWPPVPRRVLQAAFVVLPVVQIAAVTAVVLLPDLRASQPVLAASSVVGLIGLHHAFSRPDPPHLAQAIVPCLVTLGQLAQLLPSPALTWVGAIALVSASAVVGWSWPRPARSVPTATATGDQINLAPGKARITEAVRELLRDTPASSPILAVPTLAGLLVVLDRPTAVYDVFCVYPASDTEQDRMIADLQASAPVLAVVADRPLDGRDELRFSHTHPRVWDWLHRTMDPVPARGLPKDVAILLPTVTRDPATPHASTERPRGA